MSSIRYRRRGTAIVETEHGILLTSGQHGDYILPGGGAEKDESRFVAALRELTEETGLLPYYAEVIFRHRGKISPTLSGKHKFQDHHTVCFVKASGKPRPRGGDAKRITFYYDGCNVRISPTTREIIEKYHSWKNHRNIVDEPLTDEDENNAEDFDDDALPLRRSDEK